MNWAELGWDMTRFPAGVLFGLLGLLFASSLISLLHALARRGSGAFAARAHAVAWAVGPLALVALILLPKGWQHRAREERAAAPRRLVEKRVLPLSGFKVERPIVPVESGAGSLSFE